ncbi:MAG: hypothetical protein R3E53_04230 [Myxococcota bacterium]
MCPILLGGLLAAIDAPPAAAQSAGSSPPSSGRPCPTSPYPRALVAPSCRRSRARRPDAASAAAAGEGLQIERIVFEGNRALARGRSPTWPRPSSGGRCAGELAALRDADPRLRRAGYEPGARLPEQQIVDGTLRVEIVEGRLGRIDVTTDGRLRPSFVDRGLFRRGQLVSVPADRGPAPRSRAGSPRRCRRRAPAPRRARR